MPQKAKITTLETYYRNISGQPSTTSIVRNNLSTDASDYLVVQEITDTGNVRKLVTNVATIPSV